MVSIDLKGDQMMKTKSFIYLREKHVKQKILSMSSDPKFVSRLFLKNAKKMNCIELCTFRGSCRKAIFSYRYNKIYHFISFTMTGSRVFLKNKDLRSKSKFFLYFFAYFLFVLRVFTGKRLTVKKVVCDGLGNSISYKMMSVSAS